MPVTFRTRLMVWFVLTVGILLALAAAALVYGVENLRQRQVDALLRSIAAVRAESTAGDEDGGVLHRTEYFSLVSPSGQLLASSPNDDPLPLDQELVRQSLVGEPIYATTETAAAGTLRVYYTRVSTPSGPAVMAVALPAGLYGDETARFYRRVAAAAGILLIVSIVSAYWLAERSVSPLRTAASLASNITVDNLATTLPRSEKEDEFDNLSAALNDMLSRLDASFRAQRRFSSRVAHELRTPLTILKGETQVTLNRRRTPEEYEAQLNSSLEEVEKMERTIEELIVFAGYEAGETEMPLRRVELSAIADGVAKDLRPLAAERSIELRTESDDDVWALGDEQALFRLVRTLGENAIIYTPPGGRVVLSAKTDNGASQIVVSDTGIGIAEDEQPHIFRRFFRTDRSRQMNPNGSGIGLAMVEVVARLHKAEIDVASRPDDGTTFVITFPPFPEAEEENF